MNGLYISLFINLCILIYKHLRLYINLYIKKQQDFLLCNDDLYSIYTFSIKSSLIWKVQIRNFFCFVNY